MTTTPNQPPPQPLPRRGPKLRSPNGKATGINTYFTPENLAAIAKFRRRFREDPGHSAAVQRIIAKGQA